MEEKPSKQKKQEEPQPVSKSPANVPNKYMVAGAVVIAVMVVTAVVYVMLQPHLPAEVTRIIYDNQKYIFSHDIYESDKVMMENSLDILSLLSSQEKIEIIYNETAAQDLPFVTTTAFNIVYKMQQYAVYSEQRVLNIRAQPLSNTTLDANNTAYIILKGPNSGAAETSITLDGNVVTVQGLANRELEMAGDKLVMAFIGLNLDKPNFSVLVE